MKLSNVVKTKNGFVWIDTCSLDNPIGNFMDSIGLGNDDAVGSKYETMVFKCSENGYVLDWAELACKNYRNKKDAEIGHKKMVSEWKKK